MTKKVVARPKNIIRVNKAKMNFANGRYMHKMPAQFSYFLIWKIEASILEPRCQSKRLEGFIFKLSILGKLVKQIYEVSGATAE